LRERERERERVSASVVREKGEKRGVAASMVFARGRGVSASVREMERGVGECCSREGREEGSCGVDGFRERERGVG
jgi:hypothetical protein